MSHCCITTPFTVMAACFKAESTSGDLQGVCLHLSELLITCCKSKNYTSSLKRSGPVLKASFWGWWYSWTQHLESLSSTNESDEKQMSAPPLPPPPPPPSSPLQCTPPASPAAGPACVYSGQNELLATARFAASTLTFDPYSEGSAEFTKVLWTLQQPDLLLISRTSDIMTW